MSIPTNMVQQIVEKLHSERIQNLVAQTDARHILQEVKESEDNYPQFDSQLTEKVTHIAYSFIASGCSIIENNNDGADEGLIWIEKAGKILSDAYKHNSIEKDNRDNNLLIAGMSLYAAKQYSRAFLTLNDINVDFAVGQIITNFIKKDFSTLIRLTNEVFFSNQPTSQYIRDFDEWIISHEIARCFMIITDFVYSGNKTAFIEIDNILKKLIYIAIEDNLTLFWLIIRLLRILFTTFSTSSLWTVLPSILPSMEKTDIYIRLLGCFKSPVTELWVSQIEALKIALGINSGAVVNLRTSGGKTRVAELAILQTLSKNPSAKILYLAPFRSLAFELEQCLTKIFEPLGFTVSHLYGGATVSVSDFELIKSSNIIIATPEKSKALIRCGYGLETEIKLIVIDEGHLLGAEERHIRNEIFLTHLKEYAIRNDIRIIFLSAVLPNADELANWIAGDMSLVAKSEWKPSLERVGILRWNGESVWLDWLSDEKPFNHNFIQKQPLGFGRRRNDFPNDKNEAVAATAVRLSQNGTVMIYSARANSIDGIAKNVLLALGENPADFDWDETLWSVFQSICVEELGCDDIILKTARKGVICHSNRLSTHVRISIERLMRSKPPLIIIASSTLGQGVNVGISTVIVSTPYYNKQPINVRDFWNICGRAGRAYSDAEGKILYAIDNKVTKNQTRYKIDQDELLAKKYFSKQIEKVESGLLFALKTIYNIASNANVSFELLVELIANDFSQSNLPNDTNECLKQIFDLIDDELLAMHDGFGVERDNVDWVDDVFKNSLAIIQANANEQIQYIKILKARVTRLINCVPNKLDRRRIIASTVPFSVSQSILKDIDHFRNLAESFLKENTNESQNIEILAKYIREIECWVSNNAQSLLDKNSLSQKSRDKIRQSWLAGVALAKLTELEEDAGNIVKDYYGFTLPWVINAISQMFSSTNDEQIFKTYSLMALLVELGVPNETAANIYLAGVRSRCATTELSELDCVKGKPIAYIKRALLELSPTNSNISDTTRTWIELILKTYETQKSKQISFPNFEIEHKEKNVKRLLVRKDSSRGYYLISYDGYFYKKVKSDEEFPFEQIANVNGLYFDLHDQSWQLKSYNPMIKVKN
jgi:hypothetical protein